MLKKTYYILVVLVLVALGALAWKINRADKPSVVVEEKKTEKRPEVKFDLNEKEVKMLVESGIAQMLIFNRRQDAYGQPTREEYNVPASHYTFSFWDRRQGLGLDPAIGIFLPGVDDVPVYMRTNDYLHLQDPQLSVVGEIFRNREKKK